MSLLIKQLGSASSRSLSVPSCFKILNHSNGLKTSAFNMMKLSESLRYIFNRLINNLYF